MMSVFVHPQFLVLACDGIWDVMSNEEAAKYVLDTVHSGCEDIVELAKDIVDECLTRGSRDNMTALVVAFKNGPRPSA